jgi:hypothetical protein
MPPRSDGSIARMEGAHDGLIAALRVGASLADACRTVGVPERTVQNWISRGVREPESSFGGFAADVSAAREHVAAGPMDLDELRDVAAKAARGGSVPAMKLVFDLVRMDSAEVSAPVDAFSSLDELAAARQRRTTS